MRAKRREEARAETMKMSVAVVARAPGRPLVYSLEVGEEWISGTMSELLTVNYGDLQFIAEAFRKLEGAPRLDVTGAANKQGRVYVSKLWAKWDEEQEEDRAAEERKMAKRSMGIPAKDKKQW